MTKVAISPIETPSGHVLFNAISGNKQTTGKTAGEALDALTAQLDEAESHTLIIVQDHQPDSFFGRPEQERLQKLMQRWRSARDNGTDFSEKEQQELDILVEKELKASAQRAKKLNHDLHL